ncbi:MAG TPA: spermidine/putrescine ABC transporter substrate-binding protein [Actinomycetota bacterium]|jgi:spermidine/putrescine transport system substrate-binding protein|nr:spermidine/putrescine ABC transporter substrate-binding protein [Actinomycetota bacterium]
MQHPRDRFSRRFTRRDFLRKAGGTAIAVPSLAAILAACGKPGSSAGSGGATGPTGGTGGRILARPDNPVTLPLNRDPIPTDTPIESGTLRVYNWSDYLYKKVVKGFEEQYGVTVEVTTYNNMEEGIQKLVAGQVQADVFFPTTDYISRLVETDLIQPLNHDLVPNLEANYWQSFWDPGPWYDTGWLYTVPYTIYTTGVAYRRDRVTDDEAAAASYELFFDPRFSGAVSYYDSYRDALGMMMLRNGSTDPNTEDPTVIEAAKDAVLQMITDNDARLTINGTYSKLPEGEFSVSQAWSGDIVGAQWYLPKGTGTEVLGYWYPPDQKGLIGNDTITIPTVAESPRLAHEFLNFLLDAEWGYVNFRDWNGYQPPMTSIVPERLIDEGVVPENLPLAVVSEENFTLGYTQGELSAEADALWLGAWSEIQAGG